MLVVALAINQRIDDRICQNYGNRQKSYFFNDRHFLSMREGNGLSRWPGSVLGLTPIHSSGLAFLKIVSCCSDIHTQNLLFCALFATALTDEWDSSRRRHRSDMNYSSMKYWVRISLFSVQNLIQMHGGNWRRQRRHRLEMESCCHAPRSWIVRCQTVDCMSS